MILIFKWLQCWISIFSICQSLDCTALRLGIIQPWLYLSAITFHWHYTRLASPATADIFSRYAQLAPSCSHTNIDRAAGSARVRLRQWTVGVGWKHANHLRWGISAYSLSHEQTMARPITRQSDPLFDLADRPLSQQASDKAVATRD